MFCNRCGATTPEGSRFCAACGEPLNEFPPPLVQTPAAPMPAPQPASAVVYAGFWRRVLAMIVDTIIFMPVVFLTVGLMTLLLPGTRRWSDSDALTGIVIAGYFLIALAAGVGGWLYYTLMESSRHRATLGKMVAGIAVTDIKGDRISFARANGRYFAKWISGMTFYIGFIMAGITEKKQALHDIIAGCLVVRK